MGADLAPSSSSKTSLAVGARKRKVTRPSGCTSGDTIRLVDSGGGLGGAAARPRTVAKATKNDGSRVHEVFMRCQDTQSRELEHSLAGRNKRASSRVLKGP